MKPFVQESVRLDQVGIVGVKDLVHRQIDIDLQVSVLDLEERSERVIFQTNLSISLSKHSVAIDCKSDLLQSIPNHLGFLLAIQILDRQLVDDQREIEVRVPSEAQTIGCRAVDNEIKLVIQSFHGLINHLLEIIIGFLEIYHFLLLRDKIREEHLDLVIQLLNVAYLFNRLLRLLSLLSLLHHELVPPHFFPPWIHTASLRRHGHPRNYFSLRLLVAIDFSDNVICQENIKQVLAAESRYLLH
jgi:hypothetical protein